MKAFTQYLKENEYIHNVARMSLPGALDYADGVLKGYGKKVHDEYPNFEGNFTMLKDKLKKSAGIAREEMPVIEPDDVDDFAERVENGEVTIIPPHPQGLDFDISYPTEVLDDLDKQVQWTHLGLGGNIAHSNMVPSPVVWTKAKAMYPTQSEVWFEKLIESTGENGAPTQDHNIVNKTIIISRDGYILDGHHRFANVILADPNIELKTLYVPLKIDTLVKIGKGYER